MIIYCLDLIEDIVVLLKLHRVSYALGDFQVLIWLAYVNKDPIDTSDLETLQSYCSANLLRCQHLSESTLDR